MPLDDLKTRSPQCQQGEKMRVQEFSGSYCWWLCQWMALPCGGKGNLAAAWYVVEQPPSEHRSMPELYADLEGTNEEENEVSEDTDADNLEVF